MTWIVLKSEKPEQRATQLIWTKEESYLLLLPILWQLCVNVASDFGDFPAKSIENNILKYI